MVISMALPKVNPILVNQLTVIISTYFMNNFTTDEQDVIGNFFASLGAMTLFNSSYLQYLKPEEEEENEESDNDDDTLKLLQESIDKIKEEIDKINDKNK